MIIRTTSDARPRRIIQLDERYRCPRCLWFHGAMLRREMDNSCTSAHARDANVKVLDRHISTAVMLRSNQLFLIHENDKRGYGIYVLLMESIYFCSEYFNFVLTGPKSHPHAEPSALTESAWCVFLVRRLEHTRSLPCFGIASSLHHTRMPKCLATFQGCAINSWATKWLQYIVVHNWLALVLPVSSIDLARPMIGMFSFSFHE